MRKSSKVLLIFIFSIALVARITPGTRIIDDAYITFRYARNIIDGKGFVYNPGEHVLGTTTPLYTSLLSLLGFITGAENAPFPEIALSVNAIADAATALLLLYLGMKLEAPAAGVGAAFVWAILPFSVTFAFGGMETSLFVFLLTATAATYINKKYKLTAFIAGLSLLTRPDALILLAPFATDRLLLAWKGSRKKQTSDLYTSKYRNSHITIPEVLFALIPLLVWTIFAEFYFGSPLPQSIEAKNLAYNLPNNAAFIRLLQHYATPFMGHLTFGIGWIGVGLVLYLFLFSLGARYISKKNTRLWPWLFYPWLYFTIFSIANPLIFRWYLTPPLPPLILTILIGLDQFLRNLSQNITLHKEKYQGLSIIIVIIVPLLLSLQDWELHPDHGLDRPAPNMAWYELELKYRHAAEWLLTEMKNNPSSHVVAAGDVGALGYYTNAHILDTVGIISPESVSYYPTNESYYINAYAVSPQLIIDKKPDYLVILEVYGRNGLLKNLQFNQQYKLVHKIHTDIYNSQGMLIFKRREMP